MKTLLWYDRRKPNLRLINGGRDVTMPAPLESPPSHRATLGNTIAAHLDVGTIVTAVIGFSLVFIFQGSVGKIDKLTEQFSQLNERLTTLIVAREYQIKKDESQDGAIEENRRLMIELSREISRNAKAK